MQQGLGNNWGKEPCNKPSFWEQLPLLDCSSARVLPKFIVIEGVDGAGISTQARLLEQYFVETGQPCERSAEPGDGKSGRHIRRILRGETPLESQSQKESQADQALLERQRLPQYFAADRAEHIWGPGGICTKAESGIYCISERYLFSSLVYQGLEASLCEIWDLNRAFPLPEHLFYLDIPAETADQRIAERERENKVQREIFEKQDFLSEVRCAYLSLFEHFGHALKCVSTGWTPAIAGRPCIGKLWSA